MVTPNDDLRGAGRGDESNEGLQPLDPPEPLVVPPEELRRQFEEERAFESYVHLAEYVHLRSYGQVFGFMKLHMRTYQHARNLNGFLYGAIKARWWAKKFWTYTVWDDPRSLEHYMQSGPHAEMVARLDELAQPGSCYVQWESNRGPEWREANSRLRAPTRYYIEPRVR